MRDSITPDFDYFGFVGGGAFNRQTRNRAFFATNFVAHNARIFARNFFVINCRDFVAEPQTRTKSRRIGKNAGYKSFINIVFFIVDDGCADAEIFASLVGQKVLIFGGIEIVGMRVKCAEHRRNRRFCQFIVINLLSSDIVFADNVKRVGNVLRDVIIADLSDIDRRVLTVFIGN